MRNCLFDKPNYTLHRVVIGTPIVADVAVASMDKRGAINGNLWNSIEGYIKVSGGSNPNVDLECLSIVERKNPAGTLIEEVTKYDDIGTVTDGEHFEVKNNGGRVLVRISKVDGAPTQVEIYLSGGERRNTIWT